MPPATRTATTVCTLCLQLRPIVESHLLPAGFYRLLRDAHRKNPNPVAVGRATSIQISAQVKAPLLCRECEKRFNNAGERWVLQNCFRGPGEFRLLNALKAAEPLSPLTGGGAVYAGAQVPNITMGAMVYFAASVVWKAAARSWKLHDSLYQLSLGSYKEDFRLYLLGQHDFPASAAVCVNVCTSPAMFCALPRTLTADGYHQHDILVPGITFHVFVGKRIPNCLRVGCAARLPLRMIWLLNKVNEQMLEAITRMVVGSGAAGSLREG